jgi:hypothetical protein
MKRAAGCVIHPRPHDSPRLRRQAARPADPLPRCERGGPPRRARGPRRPERRGQVHPLPADHQGRAAGRGPGLGGPRRDRRLLQPGRRRDGRQERGRRDHGGRRRRERGGVGAAGVGARARRSRARRRDGAAARALRRRAVALRGAGRLRPRGAGARDPGRPRLHAGAHGRRRRRALGRVEDARRARANPPDETRRAAARRALQPPGPGVADLAGELPQGLPGRHPAHLARPRVHEPGGLEDHRDRRRGAHLVFGRLRILPAGARHRRPARRGAVRAPAGHAQEGAGLHRALQGARQPRGAGAEPHQEDRQDREGGAAQGAQDGGVRLPEAARRTARRWSTTGSTSWCGAASAGA